MLKSSESVPLHATKSCARCPTMMAVQRRSPSERAADVEGVERKRRRASKTCFVVFLKSDEFLDNH